MRIVHSIVLVDRYISAYVVYILKGYKVTNGVKLPLK